MRYIQVYATGGDRPRSLTGIARSSVESQLSFRVGGTVEEITVRVGDHVEAEDVIARLEDQDLRLRLQEAQGGLDQAMSLARNAEANLGRLRQLYERNNVSRTELDQARTAYESAAAQARSLRNARDLARRQFQYAALTAPVAGQIASVLVDVGENVQPGQPVADLTSVANLEVQVAVPEGMIAHVREGDSLTVRFDAVPGRNFPARVSEVGITTSAFATTYPVTVVLDSVVAELRSGMAAEATFRLGASGEPERFLVPPVAVGEDREGRFVYVVEPADSPYAVAHRRGVTVGGLEEGGLEVFEGLSDGDRVVTAGVSRIRDGLLVLLPRGP